jgi:RNA polymerase sigma factor (sigma-70 family)
VQRPHPFDALVVEHLPLVRALVTKKWGHVVHSHDLEDLVQAGTLGLMDAARRFDPSRDVEFPAFARPRIRGAALDYLRTVFGRPGHKQIVRPLLDSEARVDADELGPVAGATGDASSVEPRLARIRLAVLATLRSIFPWRTAEMATAHVFDRCTLQTIATGYGLTESRVCSILAPIREQAVGVVEAQVAMEACN